MNPSGAFDSTALDGIFDHRSFRRLIIENIYVLAARLLRVHWMISIDEPVHIDRSLLIELGIFYLSPKVLTYRDGAKNVAESQKRTRRKTTSRGENRNKFLPWKYFVKLLLSGK